MYLDDRATPQALKHEWLLLLSVTVVGIVVSLLLYSTDRYSLLYYGDAVSHLVGSRKIADWENPGLVQIGTVWLPLPHLLLLAPSLVDPLFTTGLAGTVVSLPSLALGTLLLYRIVRDQCMLHPSSKDSSMAYLLALLYAFNPNIMYLGIVAMTEAVFMLFLLASIYYLQRWLRLGYARDLLLSSSFVSLATLCRYEGWFLPVLLIASVTALAIRYRRKEGLQLLRMVPISLLSTTGIVLWLAWNYSIYGDPLEFSNAEYYSAAWYAMHNQYHEMFFMKPLSVIDVYMYNAVHVHGPLLLTGMAGYLIYLRGSVKGSKVILPLFLILPPAFTIASMLIGVGEMNYVYNSRFTVLLSPLLLIMTSFLIRRSLRYKWYIIAPLLLWNILLLASGVMTYMDAYAGYSARDVQLAVDAGEALRLLYDGEGRIMVLAGSSLEHRIMITSGIALNRFDEMIDHSTWKASFRIPWLYDTWLVMAKRPMHDAMNVTTYWLEREDELLMHYKVVYENENYRMMRLM
ncbi:MAG: glycosyltransferase family 39 protein [Candidatus Nitrosocaldus sp.]|nr:glycosyltransferase family 39 protein [Candidatus Nitrosocaldus sp.]